jgi:hypothetical protein
MLIMLLKRKRRLYLCIGLRNGTLVVIEVV